jgi:hypothetical protein
MNILKVTKLLELWRVDLLLKELNQGTAHHLAVDEIIVTFKGRFIFKQYIPKKNNWLG